MLSTALYRIVSPNAPRKEQARGPPVVINAVVVPPVVVAGAVVGAGVVVAAIVVVAAAVVVAIACAMHDVWDWYHDGSQGFGAITYCGELSPRCLVFRPPHG